MSYGIFVSHSAEDIEWIQRLKAQVEPLGIELYLYEDDVQPGSFVAAKLQQAIMACDAMMVLFTEHSHTSTYMRQEIGFAQGKGKLVIPLVETGTPLSALAMLQGVEYVAFDREHIEEAVGRLKIFLVRQVVAKQVALQAAAQAQTREAQQLAEVRRMQQVMEVVLLLGVLALGLYVLYRMGSGGSSA